MPVNGCYSKLDVGLEKWTADLESVLKIHQLNKGLFLGCTLK